MKSIWLNIKRIIFKTTKKPCHELGWCPYGQLVEEFRIRKTRNRFSCKVFGHDCPAFYHRENFTEDDKNGNAKERIYGKYS